MKSQVDGKFVPTFKKPGVIRQIPLVNRPLGTGVPVEKPKPR